MLDIVLLLAQPLTDPQVVDRIAETAAESSGWTPTAVNMVLGTLVVLLGAVTTLVKMFMDLKRDGAVAKVEALAVATEQKAAVVDIGAQVSRVHTLINAGDSARMEEIARAQRRIATLTSDPLDIAAADVADENVRRKALETQKAENRMDIATQTAAVVAQTAAVKDSRS